MPHSTTSISSARSTATQDRRKRRSSMWAEEQILWEAVFLWGICLVVFGLVLFGFAFLLQKSLLLKGVGLTSAGTVLLMGCWGYFKGSRTPHSGGGKETLKD
ncbi:MAG: hypothetical protein V4675_19205 [Verrucomicrobiota bacterium]